MTRVKITVRPALGTGKTEPSAWQKQRMTRQQRLYRAMLAPASTGVIAERPNEARWHCLVVVEGSELTVGRRLSDGNVEVLVPSETFTKIDSRGGKSESERAIFMGYVFVRIVPTPIAFDRLRRVKAVIDFLHDGERYHIIRDHDLGFYVKMHAERMKADPTIGERSKVQIMFGPFTGLHAVVVQVTKPSARTPHCRVWVEEYSREIKNVPIAFLQKL